MRRVLLFRPNSAVAGGVVNYYSIVLGKLSGNVEVEEFLVGRRAGLLGSTWLYPIQFILDCIRLVHLGATKDYEVYHFNPSMNRPSYIRDCILVFILALFRKERVLIFFRGWEDEYFESLVSRRWKRKIFLWFLGRASRILVLASEFQRKLQQLGVSPDKIEVTSTTFDGALLKSANIQKSTGAVTFLFMSRLIEKKGIFELVQAARLLKDEGCKFRLVIAGSGPCEASVKEEVEKNNLGDQLVMAGYLRGAGKADAIVSADIFILPTYHGEGCPNCILEAMGAGLPIITTRVGGIPDIVQEPANGILLDEVTPENIARAMRRYIEEENLRAAVSQLNKRQAWERYEANNVAKYLESVYSRVATQV